MLPEICDDKSFKVTIEELKRLLGDHRELTVVILDTFSNLDLDPTLLDDVRNAVMQTFDAANIGDLPVIIKFILQTTTVDTIQNVVMQFRKRLTLFSEDSTATRNAKSQQNTEMSMIIEALKSAFSYRRHIADGFLKVIDNDTESCVFDVVVCIVLHSIDAFKRNSVILFKKKIKAGIFNVQLISSCLKLPVRHYFTGSVLNLSDLFLRSNHSNLMKIASRMYIELFTGMNDSYHQQEFVGSLISHVGSGITAEADEAIYVLLHLTEVSPATCQALSSFVVMLKSLLDVMDTMNISQIRNLITLFCRLTVANQNKDALMKDDLNMIVRKQMSGHQYKYKWMGIVTAVTLAHHLSITTSSSPLPRDLTDHIHQLLEMVLQCCKLPIYLSLFYNELSYCLKQSKSKNTTIVEWVNDTIVSDFQDRFLSELAEVDAIQKSHLMFNIEKEDETTIYIKVYPLITSECIEDRQSLLYFVSQFKLFQTTEKNYNYGSLKNIDGLLGCPLLLHPRMVVETDTFKSLDSAQLAIYVACIVHSYNWISELLNAFASQSDEEIQCRVLSRLTHLIHLKQMLETAFPCMELNSVCMNNLPVMNMSIQSDVGPCSSKIPIKNFQQFCEIYLNDLEMDVFHIFKYKDLSLGLAKPDTNSLKLNELLFILTNLNVKLEQSLPSCASQIKPNATKSELQVTDVVVMVNFIVDILPNLCRFLEDINKALFENSESNEIETDETRIMINIIEVLFNIFYVLLNWTGFESIENEALFEKCLIKLSFRMFSSATSSSTMNIEHHFKHLYEYFKSFTNSDTEIFNRHRSYLIAFIRLLSHLSIKSKHVPYQHDISSLCEAHLKKQNVYSSSNISNQFIPFVLQNYLLLSNDIKSLETVVIHIMCELLDSSVNQSKEHPLLTRGTFHLYYKVCIYVLIEYMKKLDLSHTAMTENATILNLFIYVSVLQSLVIMVKTFDHRSIMGNVMRGSRQFIDLFLKIAMPYVDSRLRDNKEDVMLLLRNLQSSTRSLQNICNHTKVIKVFKKQKSYKRVYNALFRRK